MRCTVFLLLFAPALFAMEARVSYVDPGGKDDTLLYLSTGQVVRLAPGTPLDLYERALREKLTLDFTLGKDRRVTSAKVLATQPLRSSPKRTLPIRDFRPSVLANLEVAKKIFREGRYVDKESQCFNRAQVWAFEWFQKHNLFSEKTFLFFTRRYIRQFKFEWWFHVAPSTQVIEDGIVRQRILDVKYGRGPLRLRQWTDIFLRNDAECPVISTYSDYANYPETGHCYTMTVPMYYYQPVDVELLESQETPKETWFDAEVTEAYREAFDETWPGGTL